MRHILQRMVADLSGAARDLLPSKRQGIHGIAALAAAFGAVAVGAFALGALSVKRVAIRRLLIDAAEFKSLRIQDLTVKRLHASEVIVSHTLELPGNKPAHDAAND